MTEKRRCEVCGETLSDDDVMKLQLEDGSWEVILLPLCPKCFKESLINLAGKQNNKKKC